jgi:ubiquinone/menaquinone biosynthesis C-methylase UbiE
MSGEVDEALLAAVQLQLDDDVLVLGGGALVFGAHGQVGDGWVYVVRSQVDELEELLGQAHTAGASGVAYLVGEAPVLPLPDAAVAAAVGRFAIDDGATAVVTELARVVAPGGRVALAEPMAEAGAALAAALGAGGFASVELAEIADEVVVSGRRE